MKVDNQPAGTATRWRLTSLLDEFDENKIQVPYFINNHQGF